MKNSISGKTIRWTFNDGVMAGKSFDHTFNDDGSLTFKMLNADSDKKDLGKSTRIEKYEVATLGTDVTVVSYFVPHGFTLTVAMDMKTKKLVAFSSNDKGVSVQHGTFSEDGAPKRRQERDMTEGNPSHAKNAPVH
jgi:hypothetical protein